MEIGLLLIDGIEDAGRSSQKYLYVINRYTGVSDALTSYYILHELALKDLSLFREYRSDPTKDMFQTRLKYYKILKHLK